MKLDMKNVPRTDDVDRNDTILFSESNSRFIVEVSGEDREEFERIMSGTTVAAIGEVVEGENFKVYGLKGDLIVSASIWDLKEAWQKTFRW